MPSIDLTKPLLAIFAHPDDETFGVGGLLALAHKSGARVGVFCATRGEKGKLHLKEAISEEKLGELRADELRAAAKIFGAERVEILNYPDGGLEGVPEEDIVEKILDAIKEFGPYTIVTFGPDGGTSHRDHVAIHKFTEEA